MRSWGELWKRTHDDGCVEAKAILDGTYYNNASLAWLSQLP